MSKMTWVSAWVAATEDDGSLQSVLDDMTLEELEYVGEVSLNLDRQARRTWFRKLADRYETGEEPE